MLSEPLPSPRPTARRRSSAGDDHGGLARDLDGLVGRRRALRWMGGVGVGLAAACSTGGADGTDANRVDGADGATAGSTGGTGQPGSEGRAGVAGPGPEIPDEGAGPFPADGTNGPNVLTIDGVVRQDLTISLGGLSGRAEGIPTELDLVVVDAGSGAPLVGAAVYLWHCTADGRYSIYEIDDQNYLRGAGVADGAGRATFTTIYPGCYPGRWPHAHFEIYTDLDDAVSGGEPLKISQLALPRAESERVYDDLRYGESAAYLAELTLDGDAVFADGWADQMAAVDGSLGEGLLASLVVRV